VRFTRAIVCPPSRSFSQGLTAAGLGAPDLDLALEQHARYCEALELCGLELTRLPPDERFPDSTFVEDTAVVTPAGAIITRPGAESRRGEVPAVRDALERLVPLLGEIQAPGTLDGGDVCEVDGEYWIGLSGRTNREGARQLAELLARAGFATTMLDLSARPGMLHLKSGLAALGNRWLVADYAALATVAPLQGHEMTFVTPKEAYAANCVRVNDHVLIASGYPRLAKALRNGRASIIALDVSEFRKMDGGLSCLSLRL
jgi:dimethylargininase